MEELSTREVRKLFGLIKKPADYQSPGMGFGDGDRMLFVMPADERHASLFYNCKLSDDLSYVEAVEAIRRFYANDDDWLNGKCTHSDPFFK